MNLHFLSNTLIVHYDKTTSSLLINHPDTQEFPYPLITIRKETYSAMDFTEASSFIGSRLLLLIPEMREQFQSHIDSLTKSENGQV